MKKGIILEINDRYLTLLTPQGEFLRARKLQQDYQVGEEIHFFPEVAAVKRKKFNLSLLNGFKSRTLALSAALMLMLAVFLPSFQNGQVYAYMSIDVNPSVELELNDDMEVLNIKGYNKDGKKVVAGISDWKKKDAVTVANMIFDEFEDEGFLYDNKEIVLATVPAGKTEAKADKKLAKKISEIKKTTSKDHLELKVVHATAKEREQARKKGLTTGLYKEKLEEAKKPGKKPSGQESKKSKKEMPKKADKPVNKDAKDQGNTPSKGKPSEKPSDSKKTPESSNNKQKPRSLDEKSSDWKSGQIKSKDNLFVRKNNPQKQEKSKSKQDVQNKQIKQHQTFKPNPPGQAKKFKD